MESSGRSSARWSLSRGYWNSGQFFFFFASLPRDHQFLLPFASDMMSCLTTAPKAVEPNSLRSKALKLCVKLNLSLNKLALSGVCYSIGKWQSHSVKWVFLPAFSLEAHVVHFTDYSVWQTFLWATWKCWCSRALVSWGSYFRCMLVMDWLKLTQATMAVRIRRAWVLDS